MNGSDFTPRQRRILLLMVIAVIVVFAMFAGFVVTSRQRMEHVTPVVTMPFVSLPPTPSLPTPSPAPWPTPTSDESIWSQVQAARLFDQIAHQVETQRGLSPYTEAPLSFLDEREMTALLHQLYAEHDPGARLSPYMALGLLSDILTFTLTCRTAVIYVPEQEQLYIATGRQESNADAQALLAHAYVHALQDQHFDLRATEARAATADAKLAVQALVEGDATLSTALYGYQDLAAAEWEHLTELIVQAEQPDYGEEPSRSEAWARLQRFPYWEGRLFASALFQAGGWETINRAYTTPPRSTEQVLHPERYLEEADTPTSVVVPDLGLVLGEGWTMLLQDTLGEFVIGLYLDEMLPEATAWQAAGGWDGDTFVVWKHTDGDRVLVWRTVWDDTAEAVEFERALAALIQQRYLPVRPVAPPEGLPGHWWDTDAGAMHVCRLARYVIFVQTTDINALVNIVEVLP